MPSQLSKQKDRSVATAGLLAYKWRSWVLRGLARIRHVLIGDALAQMRWKASNPAALRDRCPHPPGLAGSIHWERALARGLCRKKGARG